MNASFRLLSRANSSGSDVAPTESNPIEPALTQWINYHIKHHESYRKGNTGYAKTVTNVCDDCGNAVPLLAVLEVLLDVRITHPSWWLAKEGHPDASLESVVESFPVGKVNKARLYPRVAPVYEWERAMNFWALLSALERWEVDLQPLLHTLTDKGEFQEFRKPKNGQNAQVIAEALVSRDGSIDLECLVEIAKLIAIASLYPQFSDARTCRFHLDDLIFRHLEEELNIEKITELFENERNWTYLTNALRQEFGLSGDNMTEVMNKSFCVFGIPGFDATKILSRNESLAFLVIFEILRRCNIYSSLPQEANLEECTEILNSTIPDAYEKQLNNAIYEFRQILRAWNVLVDACTDLPFSIDALDPVLFLAEEIVPQRHARCLVELIFQFYNGVNDNAVGATIRSGKAVRAARQLWGQDPMVEFHSGHSVRFKMFCQMLIAPSLQYENSCSVFFSTCFRWMQSIIDTVTALQLALEDVTKEGPRKLTLYLNSKKPSSSSLQSPDENPSTALQRQNSPTSDGVPGRGSRANSDTPFLKKALSCYEGIGGKECSEHNSKRKIPIERPQGVRLCGEEMQYSPKHVGIVFAELMKRSKHLQAMFQQHGTRFYLDDIENPHVPCATTTAELCRTSNVMATERRVNESWPNQHNGRQRSLSSTPYVFASSVNDSTYSAAESIDPDYSTTQFQRSSPSNAQTGIENPGQHTPPSPLRQTSRISSTSKPNPPQLDINDRAQSTTEGQSVAVINDREQLSHKKSTQPSSTQPAIPLPSLSDGCTLTTENAEPRTPDQRTMLRETQPSTSSSGSPLLKSTTDRIERELTDEHYPNEANEAKLTEKRRRCSSNSPLREGDTKHEDTNRRTLEPQVGNTHRETKHPDRSRNLTASQGNTRTLHSKSCPVIPRNMNEKLSFQDGVKISASEHTTDTESWIWNFRSFLHKHHSGVRESMKDGDFRTLSSFCLSIDSLLRLYKNVISPEYIKEAFQSVQNYETPIWILELLKEYQGTWDIPKVAFGRTYALNEQGTAPWNSSDSRSIRRSETDGCRKTRDTISYNEFIHFMVHLCLLVSEPHAENSEGITRVVLDILDRGSNR